LGGWGRAGSGVAVAVPEGLAKRREVARRCGWVVQAALEKRGLAKAAPVRDGEVGGEVGGWLK